MKKAKKNPDASLSRRLGNDGAYMEQRRLESAARTAAIKQKMAKERGELLDRKEASEMMVEQIKAARARFLQVRRKIASRHPDLPSEVLKDIEALHREALEELSRE